MKLGKNGELWGMNTLQWVLCLVIPVVAIALYHVVTTDVPEHKFHLRMEGMRGDMAREQTKQAEIAAKMIGKAPPSRHETNTMNATKGERWHVTAGARYIFPDGGGGHSVDINVHDVPRSFVGEFMLVSSSGERAWTPGWGDSKSSVDVLTFMGTNTNKYLALHSKGSVIFIN